jgi:hypothetical protein
MVPQKCLYQGLNEENKKVNEHFGLGCFLKQLFFQPSNEHGYRIRFHLNIIARCISTNRRFARLTNRLAMEYSQPHLPWYMNKKFYNEIGPIMVAWMQSMTFHEWSMINVSF